jgi:nucleoside-diphosphate-sugar epimerase
VLSALLEAGYHVRALVRDSSRVSFVPHPALTLISGEMSDVGSNEIDGCDAFIHLAAHGVVNGMNDWEACFRVNVTESLALWIRAAEAGVRRFVICGSCFEYGRSAERYDFIPVDAPLEPIGAYHASKAAATMAALAMAVDRHLELAVLRPFHVFGEGETPDRFWPSLCQAARNGADLPMSLGRQVRDFVPVENVAAAFVETATVRSLIRGRPLIRNIGTGNPQTLLEFAQYWWKRLGAMGKLQPGLVPYRANEVMRYVPLVTLL